MRDLRMNPSLSFRISLALIAIFALPVLAVSTSHWTQNTEPDFKAGSLHNVVATNLGDVKLSRAVKTLLEEDPKVSMVTSLAQGKNGVIYAGTAPQGVILQITGDTFTPLTTIPDAVSITSLLVDPDGGLIIGASGAKGRVLRIDKPGDKPREIFTAKDVQYIWSLARLPDGDLAAATGPNGQLFAIHPDGKSDEIYKSDENNLSAMVSDGKDLLYIGTDPNGLVVRVNRKTKESFVMYNAEEAEITALALDADGNLYAATGQPPSGPPQPGEAQQKEGASGRPQTPAETPLPSQPPAAPKPPAPPTPNPGQPPPIPQKPKSTGYFRSPRNSAIPIVLIADEADPTIPGGTPDVPGAPSVPGLTDQTTPDDAGAKPPGGPKSPGDADQSKPQGNAIYRIDRDGFVTEVFRQQAVIYSLLATQGVLLVGTGDDGEIFQVNPAAQETAVIAKTDAKEVTSLLAAADGRVILGLSNAGSIAAMTPGYADSGTYISAVLDASQVSRFGVIHLHGSLPKGTSLTVATRAGNVKDAQAQGWSPWTEESAATEFMHVRSLPARFLQYRITFKTTDPGQTPVINAVDVAYQMPHLAPVIKSIKITDAAAAAAAAAGAPPGAKSDAPKPAGTATQTIVWDASSPNNDPLVYALYFRVSPGGAWILLKDKLTDETFTWDTRGVADGRYEVKVTASDAAANPVGDGKTVSRISDVLTADNTPPVIGDLKVAVTGHSARIDLHVADQTSTVASMDYSVDSTDIWQAVLPADKIFDEPEETVSFSVDNLPPGGHQITLRATDAHGNVGYQTVTVTVGDTGK